MVEIVIQKYLARIRGPITWGTDDCCSFVHTICKEIYGVELMAPVETYSTQIEALRRLKDYAGGGVLEAAQKRAGELGLKRASPPYVSAVGVVAGEEGPLLALFNRDRWLVRTHDGVAVLPEWAAVIAWELPECRH